MRVTAGGALVALLTLVLLITVLTVSPAQTPDGPPEETTEYYPIIPPEDPGSIDDPLAAPELPNTLGEDLLPSDIDPIFYDDPDAFAPPLPAITPIGLYPGTNYFSSNSPFTKPKPIALIGASADNACHMHLGNGDICRYDLIPGATSQSQYQSVLADASARGLNKIRLWVAINGGDFIDPRASCDTRKPHPEDQPFVYTPNPNGPRGIGTWNLSAKNETYFNHLREVVQYARSLAPPLIVEVTFFAPWEATWELGPWHKDHGRDATGKAIGFSDRSYFVKIDTTSPDKVANEAMRAYQRKVIEWTVDTLIRFDNVYWEIANEPEAWVTSQPKCGPQGAVQIVGPKPQTALATDVDAWQRLMISHLKTYEQSQLAAKGVTRRHLVAVQPFSPGGADLAKANPDIQVINGHYTTVDQTHGGFGAIPLAQTLFSTPRAKGFNEGKISAIAGGAGIYGPTIADPAAAAAAALTDVARVRAVRAEAWEFMLNGGATFDHFGYHFSSPVGAAVRTQLGALRSFLDSWNLLGMKSSSDPPAWISVAKHSAPVNAGINWAAMEAVPFAVPSARRFLFYRHPSRTRTDLAFQGYEPVVASYPVENFYLCLGATTGRFEVKWKNLETGVETVLPEVVWSGLASCDPRLQQGKRITVGAHSYDILISVRERLQ